MIESIRDQAEEDFLREINQSLPPGVDWKQGAIDYLANWFLGDGAGGNRFHCVKPFCFGPDYTEFFNEMYRFLNLTERLQLPVGSKILDVGCGPGWVSQYLAKLGHSVVGIDICQDLIDLAEERISVDSSLGVPLDARFYVHDIELDAFLKEEAFDVAVFESTLHHFYNPVAVLRNVGESLKPNGVIGILESVAPQPDTDSFQNLLEVMAKYHTLERPYTRVQMRQLLNLTGFVHSEFLCPINGAYNADDPSDVVRLHDKLRDAVTYNYVIASRDPTPLIRASATEKVSFVHGFFAPENSPDGDVFRWSGETSRIRLIGVSRIAFSLDIERSLRLRQGESQLVLVHLDDELVRRVTLSPSNKEQQLTLDIPTTGSAEVSFVSDSRFCPEWFGLPDGRMLSFALRILAVE